LVGSDQAALLFNQPVKASETAKTVQSTLNREEERLKILMEEYQKTLSMLETNQFDDTMDTSIHQKNVYRVQIPHSKKVLVMPILEEILGRVDFYIEEKERNIQEARR
jgi:inactivated superfamily I helicase